MSTKVRTTVSIDRNLAEAAQEAVDRGEAASVSAFVSQAIADRVEHLVRLRHLRSAVEAYEAEHGPITEDEVAEAVRAARRRATVVRGGRALRP